MDEYIKTNTSKKKLGAPHFLTGPFEWGETRTRLTVRRGLTVGAEEGGGAEFPLYLEEEDARDEGQH